MEISFKMGAVIITGIALICILSVIYRFLSINGSIAAFFTGAVICYSFQWQGLIVLGFFFLTSSLLTKWKKERKQDRNASSEEKNGRTAGQVFANGGAALLAAIGDIWSADSIWLIMFCAAFAAATADTWASELGILSRSKPFHLKEWKKVEPGLSGAVSFFGTSAAILGAGLIGASYYFLYPAASIPVTIIIIFSGFMGNFADTLFGAWFEQKYYCHICKTETESKWHCKNKTEKIFGLFWVTNNVVNFSSTAVGALIAGGLYIWVIN